MRVIPHNDFAVIRESLPDIQASRRRNSPAGVGTPREAALGAREVLEGADRVKFAADRPTPTECREAVEAIYRIVDATRPAEAVGDADRGAAA